jgi:uncharacterized repeat protein (TIGR01451 family)
MINRRISLVAGFLGISISLAVSQAHAAGVAAGTLIENTATASYSTGTSTGNVQSNTVSVKVDQLLDVAVAGLNSSPVTATSTSAILSYSVTNTGNGSDTFNLTPALNVAGNSFNGTLQTLAVDTNDNGDYDPVTDQLVAIGAASPAIPADGSLKVFVLVSLPLGATDAAVSQVRLTATSATGTGTAGTVFAGKGVGGVDAVVGSSLATSNALNSIVASLAAVSLTKTATIVDQFGGASPVPGATVSYTIVAHVIGTGTAQGVRVADAIPTGTSYVASTLTLNGAGLSDSSDNDAGLAGPSGIDVALGDIAGGGADKAISFKVVIN